MCWEYTEYTDTMGKIMLRGLVLLYTILVLLLILLMWRKPYILCLIARLLQPHVGQAIELLQGDKVDAALSPSLLQLYWLQKVQRRELHSCGVTFIRPLTRTQQRHQITYNLDIRTLVFTWSFSISISFISTVSDIWSVSWQILFCWSIPIDCEYSYYFYWL